MYWEIFVLCPNPERSHSISFLVTIVIWMYRYQAALAAKKGKSSSVQGSRAPPQFTNPKQVKSPGVIDYYRLLKFIAIVGQEYLVVFSSCVEQEG